MEPQAQPLLELVNIQKRFGSVEALKRVDLVIGTNEVVGLLGDNGAGKSTLIKIVTGVHAPDKGEIRWRGSPLQHVSVGQARAMGISTVFQDRALCEQHPIWRNIFMGREIVGRFGFVDVKKEKQETARLMQQMMGFTSAAITPDAIVGRLSGGEKQGVAISRALYFESSLILLDEPTTGLSLAESQKVLSFIADIKAQGRSCICITHNIFHVFPVADRIIILDRGRTVGDFRVRDLTIEELERKMHLVAKTGSLDEKQGAEGQRSLT